MKNSEKIKALFLEYEIDAYLIPSTDEYLGEYTIECNDRLKYATGFSTSNGVALLNAKGKDYFFTDARYIIAAKRELVDNFEVCDISTYNLKTHLLSIGNLRVGFCPRVHSALQINNLDGQLVPIDENLVDLAWEKRPKRKFSDIFLHDKYAGEASISKINRVLELMRQDSVDAYLITDPHSVCWLLNIRGRDFDYTPIILCSAILYQDGKLSLFSDNGYNDAISLYFSDLSISVYPESYFGKHLDASKNKKVAVGAKLSYWIEMKLQNALKVEDYCDKLKSIKNNIELEGAISAHKKDGRAVSKLLKWVKDQTGEFTELDVVDKALEFRQQEPNFVCPSFPTIAGFNANGAIIHYRPESKTNLLIKKNGILLIDSGGQYLEGTTDITRTIAIGNPTEEQIHNFTLVLKGMISVAKARFPHGTTGAELDKLAREYLLAEGKDYGHGTGHGVGSFLSVHEEPRNAMTKSSAAVLGAGMITSIEPGFYKEGEYGIRIENLAYVKEVRGMLEFEILTLVPIDESLVDFDMLTIDEKEWLERYQEHCNIVMR